MKDWAISELKLAGYHPEATDKDASYGDKCAQAALELFDLLLKQDHSGASIGFTMQILNRLVKRKPLVPLTGEEDEWSELEVINGQVYQHNKRYPSLCKKICADGTIKFSDHNRVSCYDAILLEDGSRVYWGSGIVTRLMDDLYPITFPYMPDELYVAVEEILSDPRNGDFDTICIHDVQFSDGSKMNLSRYFGEFEDGWKEITEDEWTLRKQLAKERELK